MAEYVRASSHVKKFRDGIYVYINCRDLFINNHNNSTINHGNLYIEKSRPRILLKDSYGIPMGGGV